LRNGENRQLRSVTEKAEQAVITAAVERKKDFILKVGCELRFRFDADVYLIVFFLVLPTTYAATHSNFG